MKNFVGLFLGSKCMKREYQENPKLFIASAKTAILLVFVTFVLGFISVELLETGHTVLGVIIRYGGMLAAAFWLSNKIPNITIQNDVKNDKE